MLSSRKKRPLERASATRDARLIIIATEGELTEQIYFAIFHSSRVKVIVIPSEHGHSAPQHILRNMEAFRESYQLDGNDEMWLVIDRDNWKPKTISSVSRSCKSRSINLAVSNPCFELWLCHHFGEKLPNTITCKTLEAHLKHLLGGYNKTKYDPTVFAADVDRAVINAQALDNKPNSRWPHPVGTRVHALVASIRSTVH